MAQGPDVGIGFIAAALREALFGVDFMDIKRDAVARERLVRQVAQERYLMVMVKVVSGSLPNANKVIDAVREGDPNTKIVIGGPYPSIAMEEALRACPKVDAGIIGEGEETTVELAHRFEKKESISSVEGIVYRDKENVVLNPKKYFPQIDDLPIPAWDLIDPGLYSGYGVPWPFTKGKTVAPINVSRGCPCECAFCCGPAMYGKKVRYRKLERVMQEIELLINLYKVDEIHICDSFFTHTKSYAYEFCESLIRKNLKIHWAIPGGTRLDSLDAPLLRAMKESGCYGISAGIESGSQRILKLMKKGITKELVREKLNLIKKTAGFVTFGFFILGYPTETSETMRETIDFARSLPLDMAAFMPFYPVPGTKSASGNDYRLPDSFTKSDMEKMIRRAYREFYLRPSLILRQIKTVKGAQGLRLIASEFNNRILGRSKKRRASALWP